MPGGTVEKIEYIIGAQDKASGVFAKIGGSLGNLRNAGMMVAKGIAAIGAAASAAVVGLFAMTKSVASQVDKLGKHAQLLGTTSEELSKLRGAAELAGVGAQTLDTALQRMVRRISEADLKGKGGVFDAIEELGLSAEKLKTLKPEEQLEAIMDGMKGIGNQGDRVRIAMQLFDTEGVALARMADGFREAKMQAEQFGAVVSTDLAQKSAEFNDSMTRVGMAFSGIKNVISEELMPVFTEFFNDAAVWISEHREEIKTWASAVADGLRFVIEFVKEAAGVVGRWADNWMEGFNVIKTGVKDAIDYVETEWTFFLHWLDKTKWEAQNFGASFIENIQEGIRSRWDNFKAGLQEIAQLMRDYMPSSPAKMGPLSDLDKVGPGFVNTIAEGIDRSAPFLIQRLQILAAKAREAGSFENLGGLFTQAESLAQNITSPIVQSSGGQWERQLVDLMNVISRNMAPGQIAEEVGRAVAVPMEKVATVIEEEAKKTGTRGGGMASIYGNSLKVDENAIAALEKAARRGAVAFEQAVDQVVRKYGGGSLNENDVVAQKIETLRLELGGMASKDQDAALAREVERGSSATGKAILKKVEMMLKNSGYKVVPA